MKNFKNFKLLDCTLRDGGYYNDWDYPIDLVNCYLETMSSNYIDIVEIGFRTLKTNGYKGPYAFSKDKFLNDLRILLI